MSEWISVKDRLPEAGEEVLVYCIYRAAKECDVAFYSEDGSWYEEFSNKTVLATHWMPLPEPPKC